MKFPAEVETMVWFDEKNDNPTGRPLPTLVEQDKEEIKQVPEFFWFDSTSQEQVIILELSNFP